MTAYGKIDKMKEERAKEAVKYLTPMQAIAHSQAWWDNHWKECLKEYEDEKRIEDFWKHRVLNNIFVRDKGDI